VLEQHRRLPDRAAAAFFECLHRVNLYVLKAMLIHVVHMKQVRSVVESGAGVMGAWMHCRA
jgi:hypothetical protein